MGRPSSDHSRPRSRRRIDRPRHRSHEGDARPRPRSLPHGHAGSSSGHQSCGLPSARGSCSAPPWASRHRTSGCASGRVADTVEQVLNDENGAKLASVAERLDGLLLTAEQIAASLDAELPETLATATRAADSVAAHAERTTASMDDVDAMVADLRATAAAARAISEDVAASDGPALDRVLETMDSAARELGRLAQALSNDPSQLLYGRALRRGPERSLHALEPRGSCASLARGCDRLPLAGAAGARTAPRHLRFRPPARSGACPRCRSCSPNDCRTFSREPPRRAFRWHDRSRFTSSSLASSTCTPRPTAPMWWPARARRTKAATGELTSARSRRGDPPPRPSKAQPTSCRERRTTSSTRCSTGCANDGYRCARLTSEYRCLVRLERQKRRKNWAPRFRYSNGLACPDAAASRRVMTPKPRRRSRR